jgi:hypothetical protein
MAGQKITAAATFVPVTPFSFYTFRSNSVAYWISATNCMQLSLVSPICFVSTTSGDAQAVTVAATPATAIHLKVFVIGSLLSLIDWNFLA